MKIKVQTTNEKDLTKMVSYLIESPLEGTFQNIIFSSSYVDVTIVSSWPLRIDRSDTAENFWKLNDILNEDLHKTEVKEYA